MPYKQPRSEFLPMFSVLVVILVSFFYFNFMHLVSAQPTNFNCQVKIVGGSPEMYPGELASLVANVTGGQPQSYSWSVQGPIIKDYDDNVELS